MLKKLFRHEWKDCWRLMGILNLIVIGLTIVGAVFFRTQPFTESNENQFAGMALFFYFMFYVCSVVALSVVVALYFYYRFYKNLYTDQGYLMHTLPVTTHELIWSKAFVAAIWHLISTVVISLSIFTLVASMMSSSDTEDFYSALAEAFEGFQFDFRMIIVGILIILALAAGFAMSIFMGYASISIGQQFKKQKILGAIGIGVGFYFLIQMISSFVTAVFSKMGVGLENEIDGYGTIFAVLVIYIVLCGGIATAFYFITNNAMKNKLNLE